MKRILLCLMGLVVSLSGFSQTTIAKWTFEGVTFSGTAATSPTITAGDFNANEGVKAHISTFSATHTDSRTVWSTPAGTGGSTTKSFSSNYWTDGDYYEFTTSTSGYGGISLSFNSYSSGTGPRDFKVQYKINSGTWTDVPSTVINYTYQNGTSWTSSVKSLDLSSITDLNNKGAIGIRLVCNGTISARAGTSTYPIDEQFAGTGTSRVDDVTISAATVLPVTTTNFTAKPVNKSILLNWQTVSEQDNKHFEIERSADGQLFSSIATIAGAGNSNEIKNYAYTDFSPLAGVNYYRLLQQDFNGTTTMVKTVAVNPQLNVSQLSVFVGANGVNVTLNAEKADKANIELYDFNGRKLAEQPVSIQAGINQTVIDADLIPGLYFVKVLSGTEVSTVKFAR